MVIYIIANSFFHKTLIQDAHRSYWVIFFSLYFESINRPLLFDQSESSCFNVDKFLQGFLTIWLELLLKNV